MLTYRSRFNFRDFRNIIFVVDAIAQNVAKVPQCTLKGISRPFFLGFLEGSSFAFAVLDMTVSYVLS